MKDYLKKVFFVFKVRQITSYLDVVGKDLSERGNWRCSREGDELLEEHHRGGGTGPSARVEELASDGNTDNSSKREGKACVHQSM